MVGPGGKRVVAASLCAALATARPSEGADAASEAQARFEEGKRLYRQRHDAEGARAKFAQAYALAPRPETLWNLAVCELDLGRNEEAAAHLRRYARDPEAKPANLERLPSLLAAARAKLGAVRLEAPREAILHVDGQLVDPREWRSEALELAPGDHVFVVTIAGERIEDIVAVRVGETVVHRVSSPVVAAPPPAPPAASDPATALPASAPPTPSPAAAGANLTVPMTLGAFGLLAGGAGVAFAIASQSSSDDADRARAELAGADCATGAAPAACDRLKSAVNAGTTQAWLSVGSYAVAGALLGTAAWFAFAPTASERVEARLGPGGFALRVRY